MAQYQDLFLDTTEEHIGGPIIGPHDNTQADAQLLLRCIEALERIGV